jgi:hypothetical protein
MVLHSPPCSEQPACYNMPSVVLCMHSAQLDVVLYIVLQLHLVCTSWGATLPLPIPLSECMQSHPTAWQHA